MRDWGSRWMRVRCRRSRAMMSGKMMMDGGVVMGCRAMIGDRVMMGGLIFSTKELILKVENT